MVTLKEKLENTLKTIENTALAAGRSTADITLIAVTKTVPVEKINEAISYGVRNIGENRVQEALEKYPQIKEKVTWHLIGHLQSNKARQAVKIFDLIHSVDSLKLAGEISRQASALNKTQRILIEVNISGEEAKFGVRQEEVPALLKEIGRLPNVRVEGLMTMAPFGADPAVIRNVFKGLHELSRQILLAGWPGIEMKYLSMGMTQDYTIAIEEGANLLRVGTGIFGER